MNRVVNFVKKEAVFCIAALLAVLSMIFVPPDSNYAEYIDYRTIGLLFALMAVVAGFSKMGLMRRLAELLLQKVSSTRILVVVLWCLCFFSAMVITNDVALITFVPLAISALYICRKKELIIYTVVLQTAAANLGSMLTPMGNPQNLYIYNKFGIGLGEFFKITVPVIAVSFVLLCLSTMLVRSERLELNVELSAIDCSRGRIILYTVLALVSIFAVFKLIDYRIAVAAVAIALIAADRRIYAKIDWFLLLTFCGFFIFVGNIGRIDFVYEFINTTVKGKEYLVTLLSSQIISNVPAAVMLSGFTDNYKALILGADIGGLGTVVASLASLISLKLYSADNKNTGKYIAVFTAVNLTYLIVINLFMWLIRLI